MIRAYRMVGLLAGVATLAGCQQMLVRHTDDSVYSVIEARQSASLGATSDAHIRSDSSETGPATQMYSLNPHPVTADVPPSFTVEVPSTGQTDAGASSGDSASSGTAAQGVAAAPSGEPVADNGGTPAPVAGSSAPATDLTPDIFTPQQRPHVRVFTLADSLAYAMRGAPSLQDAKEALYLAALDLTLERHLWTPQFVASLEARADYVDSGQLASDASDAAGSDGAASGSPSSRTMTGDGSIAVSQRLPYGGQISLELVGTLIRDLQQHVTSGESGQVILAAQIPLLSGAGRTAYESRYAAERELIYAVRTYERFRRSFLVNVAATYFNLQQSKAAIANTFTAYRSRLRDWEKAEFINRMGRSRTIFEAPRAKSSLRQAEAALVSAKERYATALDRFKIIIGMPVAELLDVVAQDEDEESRALDDLLPDVDVPAAVDVALKHRLDLLNELDAVDDARRGIHIARNAILPELEFTASAALNSDPDHQSMLNYNAERHEWHAGLLLSMDDRKTERNAYRRALIETRRAQRDYKLAADTVIADVRQAARAIAQQEELRQIQRLNMEENEFRLDAARAQFNLGRITNRDVVEAENDLLSARNDYARAVAAYRNAILEFRLSTGTLRVSDDGRWDASFGVPLQNTAGDGTRR
ncbi:MAG: TolC family protein [Phycisphaerae bacterium]